MEKIRYIKRSKKDILVCIRAFNSYYALLREYIDKGNLKSSLDRGAFTHPSQILTKRLNDLLGPKRHRISLGYGQEAGEQVLREKISALENLKHGTSYKPDNLVLVAGAWNGVELVLEELTGLNYGKLKKIKVAIIGPTHYQLFQRPIEVLGIDIVGFDFINFDGSTPRKWSEIEAIFKEKPNVIFVTNPNNPNGEYFPASLLHKLIDECKKKGIYVVIDEMQSFIPKEGKSLNYEKWIQSKNVIRVDSFSKHYGLAEYRIGWVIADKEFVGNRYSGIVSRVRGLMGNGPRAANDTISELLDIEEAIIKGKKNEIQKHIDSLKRKEEFIIKFLSGVDNIEILHRDACFNLTIRIKNGNSDIDFVDKLMNRGTMLMPCEGYGYRSKDVVIRITFAERWKKIRHGMVVLKAVANSTE